jgi:DNA-binding beta-propeller fold protein YncE
MPDVPESPPPVRFLPALITALAAALPLAASAATIDTVAGTGERGYSGDGGPATRATLDQPFHCDLDGKGALYVAEANNHCVRKVDLKTGTLTTIAGTGKKGFSGDGGSATKATFNEPYAVVVEPKTGDLYVVDRLNARLRKVDGKTGIVTTVAGNGKKEYSGDGGPGDRAGLVEPNDCCLDGKGGLLIADVGDWRVRRLDLKTGTITTFAGTGRKKGKLTKGDLGDGGPAAKAVIHGARAVCIDGKGNVFVCQREGNSVRMIAPDGVISTLAGDGVKGNADGPCAEARFNGPKAIRCDAAGNVYVVDTENQSVRKIDVAKKTVTTVCGGRRGPGGDGGDALKAGMGRPHGCVVDADGVLYVADSENHRVRRVRP